MQYTFKMFLNNVTDKAFSTIPSFLCKIACQSVEILMFLLLLNDKCICLIYLTISLIHLVIVFTFIVRMSLLKHGDGLISPITDIKTPVQQQCSWGPRQISIWCDIMPLAISCKQQQPKVPGISDEHVTIIVLLTQVWTPQFTSH